LTEFGGMQGYPNHYAGDATGASKELGAMLINQGS